MQPQAQAQVLRNMSGGWQECLDQQGVFYYNQMTQQSSDAMPPGIQPLQPGAPAQQQVPVSYAMQAVAAPPQEQAVVKMVVGDWKVCEDSLGEFYFHTPTNQSYDQPPQQLVGMLTTFGASPQGAAATQQAQQQLKQQMPQMQQVQQQYVQQAAALQPSYVTYPQGQPAVAAQQYYSQTPQVQKVQQVPQMYGQQQGYAQVQQSYGQPMVQGQQYAYQQQQR